MTWTLTFVKHWNLKAQHWCKLLLPHDGTILPCFGTLHLWELCDHVDQLPLTASSPQRALGSCSDSACDISISGWFGENSKMATMQMQEGYCVFDLLLLSYAKTVAYCPPTPNLSEFNFIDYFKKWSSGFLPQSTCTMREGKIVLPHCFIFLSSMFDLCYKCHLRA